MAADEINLPDLVSHLGVDLSGLSGTVADARRQGSSVGAALGGGIQRELRDLVANLPTIDVDASTDEVDRDLARVRQQLDDLAGERIGVDISITDALRRLEELEPHLQRLSDTHPNINVTASTRAALRQLEELRRAARRADDTDVDIDVDVDTDGPSRLTDLLRGIPGVARPAAGALASVGTGAAGIGAAVPLLAGVVQTLANIAPAAGVAVTGMAAVQLASGSLKLAMVGVEDAVTAALDPSKSEEFAEALKKLSPEAQKFAKAIRDAAPALRDLQQDVQDRVFRGLGDELERTGKVVLPDLRRALLRSGDALNKMGKGVAAAARDLGTSGALGKALDSASTGLHNLSGVPGIVVKALGQIAAAAGPAFERLTALAAKGAERIGQKLEDAFESGAMERAIDEAIELLGDLWDVAENVFEIFGNIFGAVPEGGGLLGFLEDITQAIADMTGTAEVQEALQALFETISLLGETAAPLLADALALLAPVFTELAPPVQELIRQLGEGLRPIIDEMASSGVLTELAAAIGEVFLAVAPLLPALGELVAAILPYLIPLIRAFTEGVKFLGEWIRRFLVPAIQIVADLLRGDFSSAMERAKALSADMVTETTKNVSALPGKTSSALSGMKAAVDHQLGAATASMLGISRTKVTETINSFGTLPSRTRSILSGLPGVLGNIASVAGARFVASILRRADEALGWIRGIPGRARAVLGDLGDVLYYAGRSLVRGFVTGMFSMMGEVASAASSIVGAARDYFPFSPAKKGPFSGRGYTTFSGQALIQGFEQGILAHLPQLRATLAQLPGVPQLKGTPPLAAGASLAGLGGALALPTAQQLRPVAASGGDQYNTIHLHGTEATPDGMLRALSWQGLVRRR